MGPGGRIASADSLYSAAKGANLSRTPNITSRAPTMSMCLDRDAIDYAFRKGHSLRGRQTMKRHKTHAATCGCCMDLYFA